VVLLKWLDHKNYGFKKLINEIYAFCTVIFIMAVISKFWDIDDFPNISIIFIFKKAIPITIFMLSVLFGFMLIMKYSNVSAGIFILSMFIFIFVFGFHNAHLKTLLVIPVILFAFTKNKTFGCLVAIGSGFSLVLTDIFFYKYNYPNIILESDIIFTGVMLISAWLTGDLTSIERQHRQLLRKSLSSLKKEIKARKKANEKMYQLTRAVELSPSIIIITDFKGNIEYTNQKFKKVTGFSSDDVLNKSIDKLIINLDQEQHVWDAVSSGEEWSGELCSKKKSGELFWERVSVLPLRNNENIITHFLKVSEDITEHKQMEREIARLDKLNLVGEMAAGIGHEIRNPLTTVRGFLQFLATKEECTKYKSYYSLMIEELDRANSIITEYLSLAKDKPLKFNKINLNLIITTLFPLIQADALKRNNNANLELKDIPDLLLDENEIRQLILNLIRNALEAMPSSGNLIIRTFSDINNVILEIQDEGGGIPLEALDKIGTPFFTTKDDGTGLGLAVCYSIAARHDAKIDVKTSSTGTTFSVRFQLEQN
jgi:PAS domain S-box-containing protein